MITRLLHQSALLGLMLGWSVMSLHAQDASGQETVSEQANQEQEAKPAEPAAGTTSGNDANVVRQPVPSRPTLYFIGPRVSSERQQGPSIGKPRIILPQPLIARGSLSVPEPTTVPLADTADTEEARGESSVTQEVDTPTSSQPDVPELTPELTLEQPAAEDADAGELPVDPFAPQQRETAFQEGTLQQIDPSGLPVEGLGNPLDTVWQGYDRTEISAFLTQLANPSFSPALTRLADAVAGSRFTLPAPENDDDIIRIVQARLAVFQSHANRQAYVNLVEGLPADRDWSALSRHIARVHLLKGELTDACLIAETERADDADAYWVRLAAFCMAATGNRNGVDFQLGILEETTNVEPVFYQLLDQILVEAEQPPGAVLSSPATLDGALPVDILTATMARLAKVAVTDVQSAAINPLAVPLLLENPMLARSAQSKLVAYLLSRGVAKGALVADFVRAMQLGDDEKSAALSLTADTVEDDNAGSDQPGVSNDNDSESFGLEDMEVQTILLGMIANPANLQEGQAALMRLWSLAGDTGRQALIAPSITALVQPRMVADGPIPAAQIRAALARAAQLSDDAGATVNWTRALRTSVAGEDVDTDRALMEIWPLIAVRNGGAEDALASRLALWWRAHEVDETRYRKANLLFTVFDALGMTVPERLWQALDTGPVVFEGVSVAPASWRTFLIGVERSDPLVALSSLYRLMAQLEPANIPPAYAGTLVGGLAELGFADQARAVALEILVSQKL